MGLQSQIIVYNLTTNTPLCTHWQGSLKITGLRFFNDGLKFGLTQTYNDLKIVDAVACTVINGFPTGHASITDLNFNREGTKVLTCGQDRTFRVWDSSSTSILNAIPAVLGGGFDTG